MHPCINYHTMPSSLTAFLLLAANDATPRCLLQIATVNKAIGASSAVAMQCKDLVGQYLPAIIKAVQEMPLDSVSNL